MMCLIVSWEACRPSILGRVRRGRLLPVASHLIVWHGRILALTLQIILILHGLLRSEWLLSHVASAVWRHCALLRHRAAWNLVVRVVVRRLDGCFAVDVVLVAAGGLWCVQACLYVLLATRQASGSPVENTYLDQVLALWLGDQRLQLGGSEGVDQAGLRDD
jgi:hypothetical protein